MPRLRLLCEGLAYVPFLDAILFTLTLAGVARVAASDQARLGWFSRTQPIPKQIGQ